MSAFLLYWHSVSEMRAVPVEGAGAPQHYASLLPSVCSEPFLQALPRPAGMEVFLWDKGTVRHYPVISRSHRRLVRGRGF